MVEVRKSITEYFDSKSLNFRKLLSREFTRPEPSITVPRIYVYRDILVLELYREMLEQNNNLFDGIENNHLDFIEETLFSYILK
jgi:hypothetical protein